MKRFSSGFLLGLISGAILAIAFFSKKPTEPVTLSPPPNLVDGVNAKQHPPVSEHGKVTSNSSRKERFIGIPEKFYPKINIVPIDSDLRLTDDFCELLGLSAGDRAAADAALDSFDAVVSKLEVENAVSEKDDAGQVTIVIPKLGEQLNTERAKFFKELGLVLGKESLGFFKSRGTVGEIALAGKFFKRGDVHRRVQFSLDEGSGKYNVTEGYFDEPADWVEDRSLISLGTRRLSFVKVPREYKHLVEIGMP